MDPVVRMDHVQMMKETKAVARNQNVVIHAMEMDLSVVMAVAEHLNVVGLMILVAMMVVLVHVIQIFIVMIAAVVVILT